MLPNVKRGHPIGLQLRKVPVEVPQTDGALMGAEEPTLEERSDEVDARHHHLRWVADAAVAIVAVGEDDRSRLDRLLDERLQPLALDARDAGDPDAADADAVPRPRVSVDPASGRAVAIHRTVGEDGDGLAT